MNQKIRQILTDEDFEILADLNEDVYGLMDEIRSMTDFQSIVFLLRNSDVIASQLLKFFNHVEAEFYDCRLCFAILALIEAGRDDDATRLSLAFHDHAELFFARELFLSHLLNERICRSDEQVRLSS